MISSSWKTHTYAHTHKQGHERDSDEAPRAIATFRHRQASSVESLSMETLRHIPPSQPAVGPTCVFRWVMNRASFSRRRRDRVLLAARLARLPWCTPCTRSTTYSPTDHQTNEGFQRLSVRTRLLCRPCLLTIHVKAHFTFNVEQHEVSCARTHAHAHAPLSRQHPPTRRQPDPKVRQQQQGPTR